MICFSVSAMFQVCPDIAPLSICGHLAPDGWQVFLCLHVQRVKTVPPAYPTISLTEKEEKEKLVFEKALSDLNSYWDGKTHDGFRVTSKGVPEAYSTEYKDFDLVKEMVKSSNKSIKACKQKEELLDEWKHYIKHMDRRQGMFAFAKEYVMIGHVTAPKIRFMLSI